MNKSTWAKMDEMFAKHPVLKAGPVAESEILETAAEFGQSLPADYVQFICRYGGATVGLYDVHGLRASAIMGTGDHSVFEVTRRFIALGWEIREKALVISADHAGNPVCLLPGGEVWILDHDFGGTVKLAEDFEGYLLSRCLT